MKAGCTYFNFQNKTSQKWSKWGDNSKHSWDVNMTCQSCTCDRTCLSGSLKLLKWAGVEEEEEEEKVSFFIFPVKWKSEIRQSKFIPLHWFSVNVGHLQCFCSADSPSWCGCSTHTGSSSGSPVRLSSSSARFSAWPGLCRRLPDPVCLAGIRTVSPHPSSAWI